MLLGKRTRPSIRRTTSMKGLSLDPINLVESSESSDLNNNNQLLRDRQKELGIPDGFLVRRNTVGGGGGGGGDEENVSGGFDKNFLSNVVPLPRNHRRNSGDFSVEPTANFLRSCDLCKRRLAPGRDIFIYRGDTAFCSLECREQKINQDERKERHSWVKKIEATPMTAGSETLSSEETIIAA